MEKVYEAMKGNVDGWYKAYVSLQTKGNHLGVALVQLGSIVAEMDRRAGEVSRKTRVWTPEVEVLISCSQVTVQFHPRIFTNLASGFNQAPPVPADATVDAEEPPI